ncbi:MAG: shikimate dehydrogenase [Flavobacteriales bacterium]|nr:shikimate dehydrogenase [Flavobacteriales bacterium]
MKKFGLIGKLLSHSFSKKYFECKFSKESIPDCHYDLFELNSIEKFNDLISRENLSGINVTIPYKESIIPFLNELSPQAKSVGAVNCIEFLNGKLIGHNTDIYGFRKSLEPLLNRHIKRALILGSGGASKAIKYVLSELEITYSTVSRSPQQDEFSYENLTNEIIAENLLIINTTPLGMFPDIETFPNIPYRFLTPQHILYDLVYNPAQTAFLSKGKKQGCTIKNGQEMLELQAEKSWAIWNSISPKS